MQPTRIFLPGELHGQRSLEGYGPQGHKESDMTERLNTQARTESKKSLELASSHRGPHRASAEAVTLCRGYLRWN